MKVLGIDIARQCVVACLVDSSCPKIDARELYYQTDFLNLPATAAGIKALLELHPDKAVMEPTGINYSKLWMHHLAAAGVEVVLVGHKELRSFRVHLDLPDKDDAADALALALYLVENVHVQKRFVQVRDPIIAQLRDTVLRLSHLARVQSPIINRLRQDLDWQFPEVADMRLEAPLFWGWLAGDRQSKKYDELLANSCGLGIKPTTKSNAKVLVELLSQEQGLENAVVAILLDKRFESYVQVFKQFGFGVRVQAMILSQIYPLESFLVDGQPEVKIHKGRYSKKPTKHYLSLRRFKKTLGVAPTREESGNSARTKKAGSALCRKALWQWLFTKIEPRRNRPMTNICDLIAQRFDKEKSSRPIKLARSRTRAYAVQLLFYELVKLLK